MAVDNEAYREKKKKKRYPSREQRVQLHCVAACISAKDNNETSLWLSNNKNESEKYTVTTMAWYNR